MLETEAGKKFMKMSLMVIGIFLLVSFAASIAQNSDSKNGYYSATGRGRYSMDYSHDSVDISMLWSCGEASSIIRGRPSVHGNKVRILNPANPAQIVGELTVESEDTFTMLMEEEEGKSLVLVFRREKEPNPWRRIMTQLGVPSHVIP